MTKFRKITAGFLTAIMLLSPCYAFADVLEVGESVSESFDSASEGTDFWDLSEYVAENSEMFSKYLVNTSLGFWVKLPGVAMAGYTAVSSAAHETAARETVANASTGEYVIDDSYSTAKISDGSFRVSKLKKTGTHPWFHSFTLKNPMAEGVYRLSFELDKPYDITSFGNRFIYLYDFEPDEKYIGSTSGYGSNPLHIGFNAANLYFSTNYNPATGGSESWNGTPATSFGAGTYDIDIIVDADNKRMSFFVNDNFVRSAVYTGEAITTITIYGGQGNSWLSSSGEAVYDFDNFEQERLVTPTYNLNVEDGAYDVPVDTMPAITFATAVDKKIAEQVIISKDGTVLEGIERTLSEDGTEITFDLKFDYSAEYKFEMPGGNRALNRAPIIEDTVTFRTEHKPTNVVVESETKPEYVSGEKYTATVILTNTSESSVQATYIAALYDSEGRMFDIDYSVVTLGANAEDVEVSVTLPADDKTDVTVKTFLMDTLKTMNPLVTAIN